MTPFLAFLAAALLLAVTPGPGMAYVVARTVAAGRAEGLASCAGTAVGGLLHVGAAVFGLSLLVAQSAVAFGLVKFVGAAYLVFLGIRLLWRRPPPATAPIATVKGTRQAFRDGAVVEALNVKTALFFLAFLPQFVSAAAPVGPQLALLGSICVGLNTAADVVAVLAAQRLLRSGAARSARVRLLNGLSGATMIGLGAWLALARRPS